MSTQTTRSLLDIEGSTWGKEEEEIKKNHIQTHNKERKGGQNKREKKGWEGRRYIRKKKKDTPTSMPY